MNSLHFYLVTIMGVWYERYPLIKGMNPVVVFRPVTPNKLASALEMKPFVIIHHLMEENCFVTLHEILKDEQVLDLARKLNVEVDIRDVGDNDYPGPKKRLH